MKILMLTDRLDMGGAETHIAELSVGLRARGVDVTILSSGGRISDRLEQLGVKQIRAPICTHNPLRLLRLRKKLKRLIRQDSYDILHAHARVPAFLLRGLRSYGAMRVVTVHARFHSNRWLTRFCFWGDRTIAVSEDLRRYVCDTYQRAGDRICVIPNGINCRVFSPAPEKRECSHGGIAPYKLLFASRLDRDCSLGAEHLCRIAPALCRTYPNLTIGIAGGGNALEQIGLLAEAANRTVGRECIRLHGAVEDMPSLLREQDIFIGVSRAAMEAAACGCAVILCGNEGYLGILSQQNATDAILSNFCCRGCEPVQALRLECDLRHLLDRPNLCRRLGAEARELIQTEYDAEGMCSSTLRLYQSLLHPPYRHRLLIGGYFGCGNAGDDAILLGFLHGMHEVAPDVQVRALTASPELAEQTFGIPCTNRKNPIAIRFALRGADAFLCGGGSLLQNETSERSLRYYLSLLRMAKRKGCITVLYAAGIGPIYGKKAEQRLKRVLSLCDYISLRDPDSLRYLAKLGIDRSLLHEGADPALLLPLPPPTRSAAILCEHGISPAKRRLCVILRRSSQEGDHLWQSVLIAVRILCRRHGMEALFLRFCDGDELPYAYKTVGKSISVRAVEDLAALLRDSHGILSMRLHALILAAASATAAIGLPTNPSDTKIPSFARISGQTALFYPRPSVGEIVDLFEHVFLSAHAKNDVLIANAVSELRKKAQKDLANIVEMLYNKDNAEG